MSLYKPTGSNLYYYRFQHKKQAHWGATGTADRRKAKQVEDAAREKVKRDYLINDRSSKGSTGACPTWEECVDLYLERRAEEGGIVNQRDDEEAFDRLTEWIGAETPITAVSEETVRKCIHRRSREPKRNPMTKQPSMRINPVTGHSEVAPLSTATVNRQTWQLIRRIHLFAGKKLKVKDLEVIDWSDFAKGRMEPVRTREITFEDEDKIALLSDRGYGAVFRFGQLSGLRWHALCTLRWSQVNFADMEITIRNKRSARSKENRSHTIPIDSAMLDLLRTEKGNHPEFVFTFEWEGADWRNPKNGTKYKGGQRYPVTPWGFRSWFERVKREAKLVDVRIHDIRRTAGGRVNRGAGLVAAQKLLGHASVATTAKHYAHHTTDEQREAQERAHSATKARRKRLLEIDSLDETSQREYQGPIKVRVPK